MQSLIILSIVPALGILLIGAIITCETWIGGRNWPSEGN